jgi:hypothetical protein
LRNRTPANNLGWLRRSGLSLLKQQDDKHGIAMRRRVAGWNVDHLAQVLGIPTISCALPLGWSEWHTTVGAENARPRPDQFLKSVHRPVNGSTQRKPPAFQLKATAKTTDLQRPSIGRERPGTSVNFLFAHRKT